MAIKQNNNITPQFDFGTTEIRKMYFGSSLVYDPSIPVPPAPTFRYWKYTVGTAVADHHPRVSRIDLLDASLNVYNFVTYVADNCADSGTIPTLSTAFTYDFGSGNGIPTAGANAQFYNTYGGGRRAANVVLAYSTDNVSFTTLINGVADSDANPSTPRCGLHTIS
jgi:hypothetical protein